MMIRKLKIYSKGKYLSTEEVTMDNETKGSYTISYPLDGHGESLAKEFPELDEMINYKETYSKRMDEITYYVRIRPDEPDSADIVRVFQALRRPFKDWPKEIMNKIEPRQN